MKPWRFWILQKSLQWIGLVLPSISGAIALRFFTTPGRLSRPEWERKIISSGEPLRLQSGLSATTWGRLGAPVVFLVHGWRGRGSQLGYLVEPLVAKGFRVVAIDGPAHGDSAGVRTSVHLFSRYLTDAAVELSQHPDNLDTEKFVPIHIVAHSFGAAATALALINGSPIQSAVFVAAPSNLQHVMDFYSRRLGLSPRVKKEFERQLSEWIKLKPGQTDLANAGRHVRVPVLVVHDPLDKEVAFANAERFVQNWPSSTLVALTKVGHYRVLKSPEFIQEVVKFLAGD